MWVVHLDWLFFCRWALARAEEKTFMLIAQVSGKPLPSPVINKDAPLPQPDLPAAATNSTSTSAWSKDGMGEGAQKRRREDAFPDTEAIDDEGNDDDGDNDDDDDDDDDVEDDFDFDAVILRR